MALAVSPIKIPAGIPVEDQMDRIRSGFSDVYNRAHDIEVRLEALEPFFDQANGLDFNRIVGQLKSRPSDNIHGDPMPDKAGINGDHDARYYRKAIVDARFDLLEDIWTRTAPVVSLVNNADSVKIPYSGSYYMSIFTDSGGLGRFDMNGLGFYHLTLGVSSALYGQDYLFAGINGLVALNVDAALTRLLNTTEVKLQLSSGNIGFDQTSALTKINGDTAVKISAGANGVIDLTTSNLVVNEAGAGSFVVRMEGDTDANLFYLDSTADGVGIGTSPSYKFHVRHATSTIVAAFTSGGTVAQIRVIDTDLNYHYFGGNSTRTWVGAQAGLDAANLNIDNSGNASLGVTGASARLHLLATTEQLRIAYDGSNYASFTVDSAGRMNIVPTGAGVGIGVAAAAQLHVLKATEQLRLAYDNISYSKFTQDSSDDLSIDVIGVSAPTLRIKSGGTEVANFVAALATVTGVLNVNSGTTDLIAAFASSDDLGQISISDDDTTARFGAKDSTAFFGLTSGLSAANFNLTSAGIAWGATVPAAAAYFLKTTEQLRLAYDASNYSKFTVSSAGSLLIETVGPTITMGDTDDTLSLALFGTASLGGGTRLVFLGDGSAPGSAPSGGILYYSDGGVFKARTAAGITTLAA